MSDFMDSAPIARKTLVLFFLLDVSGSMDGEKIGTLNDAFRETLPELKDLSNDNADAEIRLALLTFSNGAEWLTPQPVDLNTYKFRDLEACGGTDLGEAFTELQSKLDKNAFLSSQVGNFAPVIILMSDGEPTDDWEDALSDLNQNKWFKAAIKIAFSIGADADNDMLSQFTGNKELVINTDNKKMLKKMIKFVSVHSTKIGGSTRSTPASKQEEVAEVIQEEIAASEEDDVDGGW